MAWFAGVSSIISALVWYNIFPKLTITALVCEKDARSMY